jgi:hypothetical protein
MKKCSGTELNPIQQKYDIAGVLLGVGGAAVVFGVVLLAVRPFHATRTGGTTSVRLSAAVTPGQSTAWLRITF